MNRRRAALALGAILTASLALSACAAGAPAPSSSEAADATPVSGGTLTYLANTEPGTWDGQKVPSLNLNSINSSIFDSLVAQADDGTYKPHLSTEWEVSDDGLVYTFQLRDDVVFHDGTPFDAAVLKQNLDRPPERGRSRHGGQRHRLDRGPGRLRAAGDAVPQERRVHPRALDAALADLLGQGAH